MYWLRTSFLSLSLSLFFSLLSEIRNRAGGSYTYTFLPAQRRYIRAHRRLERVCKYILYCNDLPLSRVFFPPFFSSPGLCFSLFCGVCRETDSGRTGASPPLRRLSLARARAQKPKNFIFFPPLSPPLRPRLFCTALFPFLSVPSRLPSSAMRRHQLWLQADERHNSSRPDVLRDARNRETRRPDRRSIVFVGWQRTLRAFLLWI